MKAYVWRGDVLCDWTCGSVVAVANSEAEARAKAIAADEILSRDSDFLNTAPEVVEVADLVLIQGGGS